MIIEQGWEKVDVKEREYSRDEGDFKKKLGEARIMRMYSRTASFP